MVIGYSLNSAAELIHDAMDAAEEGYHDRASGVIDTTSGQLAAALLIAGWTPPGPASERGGEIR